MNKEINPREFTDKSLDELRQAAKSKLDEQFKTHKLTPELAAYWDRVYADRPPEKDYPIEEGKRFFVEILNHTVPGFKYTPENKAILKNLVHWVYNDRENTDYILSRGILLIGIPGSGKTSLMKALGMFCRSINRRPFNMCYTKEITQRVEAAKDLELMAPYRAGDWCFDELGHEMGTTKIWGNQYNLFGDLLEYRYRRVSLVSHGTTNLDISTDGPVNLRTVYGERVYSRMHEMFNIVYLNGQDWRIKNH